MNNHDDVTISEIDAPKKSRGLLFTSYPTPPSSLDAYTGGCLDASDNLGSKEWQPKCTLAWYKNDTNSMVLIAPKIRSSFARVCIKLVRHDPKQ